MIKDIFYEHDLKITILYDCTCDDIDYIIDILIDIHCPLKYINEAVYNLETCQINVGLTYSNLKLKSSVIVIGRTSSIPQLINTISHEYFHLICHIAKIFDLEDEEELANLNGNLNMRSYKIIETMLKK